jgi:hypothetical protein
MFSSGGASVHQNSNVGPSHHHSHQGHGQSMDNSGQQANLAREKEKQKKLSSKKQKFDELFKKKLVEFKDAINKNLKERFDKDLKRALYHLWKHYENCTKFPTIKLKSRQQIPRPHQSRAAPKRQPRKSPQRDQRIPPPGQHPFQRTHRGGARDLDIYQQQHNRRYRQR